MVIIFDASNDSHMTLARCDGNPLLERLIPAAAGGLAGGAGAWPAGQLERRGCRGSADGAGEVQADDGGGELCRDEG